MSSYTHFTLDERKYLQELLADGYSIRRAAAALGRSPSSVSREIARNKSKWPHGASDNPYRYHHWRAQNLYIQRRRASKHYRLNPDTKEWEYIIEKLQLYWSPEQICGRCRLEHPDWEVFGVSTIYRAIKRKAFPGIRGKTHLRRRQKHYTPRKSNYNTIHPSRIIPDWPEEIRTRSRIGDWEGDTVYGGVGKGLLVTQVDRRSRFLRAGLLERRDASLTKEVIVSILSDLPVHSISLDNGSEFALHEELEAELGAPVFFAEPHKPWQRGTNENTNDLLRFFFPKGFDFHSITQADVDAVVALLNNRPRKCLSWLTPAEVFFDTVALA